MAKIRELQWWRKGKTPSALVFVHGFTGSHGTWKRFIRTIRSDRTKNSPFKGWSIASFGYPSSLLGDWLPFWKGDPDIKHLAKLLQTTCEAADLAQFNSFAFVAHSMGGLIVQRALLDGAKLRAHTTLFYMYGTPSNGAELSRFIYSPQRQIPDMAPGSEFLGKLRADWKASFDHKPPFTFMTVAGSQDQFIKPESSLEPFADDFQQVVSGDHLSMIRCDALSDPAVALLANGVSNFPFKLGPIETASVAAEKSDFQKAIQIFTQHKDELDPAAEVQLALALEMTGQREKAIDLLTQSGSSSTDVLGSLGGQLKRRWNIYRKDADAKRALSLYTEGYERSRTEMNHRQAHYHGINVAFMQLVYLDKMNEARATAREVLKHCEQAENDPWRHASVAEAKLILDEHADALKAYQVARQHLKSPRDLLSAYNQARWILAVLHKENLLPSLDLAFEVDVP